MSNANSWGAWIGIDNGEAIELGVFDSPEEAARVLGLAIDAADIKCMASGQVYKREEDSAS